MMYSFHKITLGITNCFLISSDKGYLLVDTSVKSKYAKFIKELQKLGISLSEIKFIFLTHHHLDHTGFLKKLMDESAASFIVHKNALPWLDKGVNNTVMKGTTAFLRFLMKLQGLLIKNGPNERVRPDDKTIIINTDNNLLLRDALNMLAKIICLPGHTSDSIGIVFDDGNAFVGDAAVNMLHFLRLKNRPIVAEDAGSVWPSWEKIQQAGGKTIYVSHGNKVKIETLISKIKR